jgi:endonuclease YncB( thermonuclease family)
VSKHWNPGRKPVALGKSRIRRDPVPVEKPKLRAYSPELEMWGGVVGVIILAAAITALAVGIGFATFSKSDPAADANPDGFGQCYNGGRNCVLDGQTIYYHSAKYHIAGMDVPAILDAKCPEERNGGIGAALHLAELLNSGKVTVSPTFRDFWGRSVSKVQVDGQDVAPAMIASGAARAFDGDKEDWCP